MTTLANAKQEGRPSEGGRFLRINDVMATIGLGRSTIYRMVGAGSFPKPIKLTVQTTGWWQRDVDAWMRDRRHKCPQRH